MARVTRGVGSMVRCAMQLTPVLVLCLAWEAIARSGAVTPFMLPPLSAVTLRIANDFTSGDLVINIAATLYRALLGFGICTVAGVALGTAMSRSRIMRWFFDPIVSIGFPMPKIAFLPIIILWLGSMTFPRFR